MAKKRDHADELRAYLAGDGPQILSTLRSLPAEIDPELVTRAALKLLDEDGAPGNLRLLPAAAIRRVLATARENWGHTFLQLAVDGEAKDVVVVEQWREALEALVSLNLTYAWRSKPRRERFRKLARAPRLLRAIQGTAANRQVPLDLLAVLVADASADSLDALVPHLDRALGAKDGRLERVKQLKPHAKMTPALKVIFREIETTLDARNAVSPALALAQRIGLGTVPAIWFSASMLSREANARVPRIQGSINIDSRKARWFSV